MPDISIGGPSVSKIYAGDTEVKKVYCGSDLIWGVISFSGTLSHTLDNPNAYGTSANDNFGESVAISESYAIVGAFREGDAGGTASGKAYIFNPATGALLHTLDNPNAYGTSEYDNFGKSVAINNRGASTYLRQPQCLRYFWW